MNEPNSRIRVNIEISNNPDCFIFRLNTTVLQNSYKFYERNTSYLEESNLIYKLFHDYEEIEHIFVSNDFLSILFTHQRNSIDITLNKIKQDIHRFFIAKNTFFNTSFLEIINKLKLILTENINPACEMEGGHYELFYYSHVTKDVVLKPLGSCRKSPSLKGDLIQIKNIMQHVSGLEINSVRET